MRLYPILIQPIPLPMLSSGFCAFRRRTAWRARFPIPSRPATLCTSTSRTSPADDQPREPFIGFQPALPKVRHPRSLSVPQMANWAATITRNTGSKVRLPHQITGVYEAMLSRLPLRFLLADDPGAGKTIMGLLMKELIARGDLHRCLVVCPGSLAEQWQDELYRRFHLPFDILTNDKLETARTGNWFLESNLVIARLDKLSRNEDVQEKLLAPDCRWDLIVCDEHIRCQPHSSVARSSTQSVTGWGSFSRR